MKALEDYFFVRNLVNEIEATAQHWAETDVRVFHSGWYQHEENPDLRVILTAGKTAKGRFPNPKAPSIVEPSRTYAAALLSDGRVARVSLLHDHDEEQELNTGLVHQTPKFIIKQEIGSVVECSKPDSMAIDFLGMALDHIDARIAADKAAAVQQAPSQPEP